jgi:hypothetical protein
LIVPWRFQTPPDESAPVQAAADDVGRVIVFAELEPAEVFAGRLRSYGLDAAAAPVDGTMVAQLLDHNGHHDPDAVTLFEASTTGPEDALTWAAELADRFIARLASAFDAAVDDEAAS